MKKLKAKKNQSKNLKFKIKESGVLEVAAVANPKIEGEVVHTTEDEEEVEVDRNLRIRDVAKAAPGRKIKRAKGINLIAFELDRVITYCFPVTGKRKEVDGM